MRMLILPMLNVAVSPVHFELEKSVLDRETFLENIVKSVHVSCRGECAFHCDGHQKCSAFGFNIISKVCQRFSTVCALVRRSKILLHQEGIVDVEHGFRFFKETGQCFRLTYSENSSNEAEGICNSFGGRLAVLNTEDKRKDNEFIWVGASDSAVEIEWVWSDDTAVLDSLFLETEPNRGTEENCLLIRQERAYDASCDLLATLSLCEVLEH